MFSRLIFNLFSLIPVVTCRFSGWIDPDTSSSHYTLKSYENPENEYDLVMSDEFNRDGRSFKDGHDPRWTALLKSDDDQTAQGKKSLQYYNDSHAYTKDGALHILTTTDDTHWLSYNPYKKKYTKMTRHFRSAMVQGWNKFCFTGGIIELDLQLPGDPHIGGLWPAVWLLGNLGRATYEESTNLLWPWSYDVCDREKQHAQVISACDVTQHFDFNLHQGRGATEIDILEIMPGKKGVLPFVKNPIERPYVAMTLQAAPGIPAELKRPQSGTLPEWGFTWYENLTYGVNVSINPFFYGSFLGMTKTLEPVSRSKKEEYQCDAIGAIGNIDESYWKKMHKFRLEWEPGPEGYLRWYYDGKFKFGVEGKSLNKLMGTMIPTEPSYVIINTAISTSWGFPEPPPGCTEYDCKVPSQQCGFEAGFCHTLPTSFLIDHIRIYQNKKNPNQTVGCNPKNFPTKKFIQGYAFKYKRLKDKHPLKPIMRGRGSCKSNEDCGEGICNRYQKCECHEDWKGPHCKVLPSLLLLLPHLTSSSGACLSIC
jgi:beta-glucan synthesis-associated protein KRE6